MNRSELYELETPGDTPAGQISPQPWLASPETSALFAALQVRGGEARFVGGCVRDALAKRAVHDIDIATTTPPGETQGLLERADIRAIPTGLAHGTVTAVINKQSFEITTLREDIGTDGRHATVAFTTDWYADAKRRDFTINALSATQTGAVYDPFNGIADLAYGRVRFIGRPAERIAEDHLRILRFFRFHASHGKPPADRDGMIACRLAAEKIHTLSPERVRDEMMKILATLRLVDTLLLMRGEGVLEKVLPEAGQVGRLRSLIWLTTRAMQMAGVRYDPLRNLAALLSFDHNGSAGRHVAERWKMSNADRDRLTVLTTPLDLEPCAGGNDVARYLYTHGADTTRDRALLAWASEISLQGRLQADRTAAWVSLLETAEGWMHPVFPLAGQDIIDCGIKPGPRVGEILGNTEQWWASHGFTGDKQHCLEFAKSLIKP